MFQVRPTDGGPVYTETKLYFDSLSQAPIVEPWNAASALVFVLLVIYWGVRLRGRYSKYPFLSCCLPILLLGGIGGTLYHATRSERVFFLMDVLPILGLCLATSIYLWYRCLPKWWNLFLVVPPFFVLQQVGFQLARRELLPWQSAVNLSYAIMAVMILIPTVMVLIRTRFRNGVIIALALALFGIALFFRGADIRQPPLLPIGTHWLWHVFGAAACAAIAEYLYRLERDATS